MGLPTLEESNGRHRHDSDGKEEIGQSTDIDLRMDKDGDDRTIESSKKSAVFGKEFKRRR